METATLDFTGEHSFKRGATRRVGLALEYTDGTPMNLTGATANAKISREPERPPITQFDVVFVDASKGLIELVLSASDSTFLTEDTYFWDIFLTLVNGDVVCPLQGMISVFERVS